MLLLDSNYGITLEETTALKPTRLNRDIHLLYSRNYGYLHMNRYILGLDYCTHLKWDINNPTLYALYPHRMNTIFKECATLTIL